MPETSISPGNRITLTLQIFQNPLIPGEDPIPTGLYQEYHITREDITIGENGEIYIKDVIATPEIRNQLPSDITWQAREITIQEKDHAWA